MSEGRPWRDAGIPVLLYHRIAEAPDPRDPLAVPVDAFERQMGRLHRRGYRAVEPHKALDSRDQDGSEAVLLTFDDGYRDFRTRAYPVLRRFGFGATVFLVAERVGGTSDWEGGNGVPLLDWEEILELQEAGIRFGSHTATHRRLSGLPLPEARREIHDSRRRLEDRLGSEVPWLAYPYGDSDERARRLAAEAGYRAAYGVLGGPPGRFNLDRRQILAGHGPLSFRLALSRFYPVAARFRFKTRIGRLLWPPSKGAR